MNSSIHKLNLAALGFDGGISQIHAPLIRYQTLDSFDASGPYPMASNPFDVAGGVKAKQRLKKSPPVQAEIQNVDLPNTNEIQSLSKYLKADRIFYKWLNEEGHLKENLNSKAKTWNEAMLQAQWNNSSLPGPYAEFLEGSSYVALQSTIIGLVALMGSVIIAKLTGADLLIMASDTPMGTLVPFIGMFLYGMSSTVTLIGKQILEEKDPRNLHLMRLALGWIQGVAAASIIHSLGMPLVIESLTQITVGLAGGVASLHIDNAMTRLANRVIRPEQLADQESQILSDASNEVSTLRKHSHIYAASHEECIPQGFKSIDELILFYIETHPDALMDYYNKNKS